MNILLLNKSKITQSDIFEMRKYVEPTSFVFLHTCTCCTISDTFYRHFYKFIIFFEKVKMGECHSVAFFLSEHLLVGSIQTSFITDNVVGKRASIHHTLTMPHKLCLHALGPIVFTKQTHIIYMYQTACYVHVPVQYTLHVCLQLFLPFYRFF